MRLTTPFMATLAGAATLATVFVAAPTAEASGAGSCVDNKDICLYYNSGKQGAFHGVSGESNYTGLVFGGRSSGKGVPVKNNAASVWNRSNLYAMIYYNSNQNCSYACQYVTPKTSANLNSKMKNNNASQTVSPWGNSLPGYPGR